MDLATRISHHLAVLVDDIGARPPGSPANRRATDHLATTLEAAGFMVEALPFDARCWEPGPAAVGIGGTWHPVEPAPFGRPCDVTGTVVRASTDAELDALSGRFPAGGVLIVDGELATEPLFPKAYPFLELPGQRDRITRLEALAPAAVIGVVAGPTALPLFEDADLAFPYLLVDPSLGGTLVEGEQVGVRVAGAIVDGAGVNIAARPGRRGRPSDPGSLRVISAHVDSKATTPGAFDNAGGVAVLLALAETGALRERAVELVFFNGEDHYAAPGEVAWLAATDLGVVGEAVNLDGAGVAGRGSTATALACPPDVEARLGRLVERRPRWSIAPPWFESDHAIFAMRGIPSIAITSENVHDLLAGIAHTDADTLDVVDPAILADVGSFVLDWVAGAD